MVDENALGRWFSLEMGKMLEGFVPLPRPLHQLLRDPRPSAPTRGGEPHLFDPQALHALAEGLSPLLRARTRLPLTLHIDSETPGDAYAADPAAIEILQTFHVGLASEREGRLWLSLPLARDFARRFPTLVQFVPR